MKKIDKSQTKNRPASIEPDAIAAVARQGVTRALAARQAMVDMSDAEIGAVDGGVALAISNGFSPSAKLLLPIIAGGIWGPIDLGGLANPALGKTTFG